MAINSYCTSTGWPVDLRKLHRDDALFIREESDPDSQQVFIDQCFTDYLARGRDIRKAAKV
jgi:hypothetical protein